MIPSSSGRISTHGSCRTEVLKIVRGVNYTKYNTYILSHLSQTLFFPENRRKSEGPSRSFSVDLTIKANT